MSKHEAEISPSAMLYRTVAIKKDNIPNSMLSRRPTPYYFDYTVVLHSHPSAIKTFISLNCSHYNRPDRIRQGLLSIFYQNRVWFLCNCVSSGMVSQKFSYILQATPTHCLLLCAIEARDLPDSRQADIRNPLRYLLITECCFAAYQEWLAPLLIQASPKPLPIRNRGLA